MKHTRTFRPLAIALTLAAATGLSGCRTLDLNAALEHGGNLARTFNQTVTPQEEARMGEESAALLLGAAPLVQNPGLQRYVNQVGQWIALQTGRHDVQWRFGVLETENINAFAAPAGYVFVTKGLLQRLQNESELAGVLAHEISHVIMGHYVQTMIKKDRAAALGGLANTLAQSQGKGELAALVNLTRGSTAPASTRMTSIRPTAWAWCWPPGLATTPSACPVCCRCMRPTPARPASICCSPPTPGRMSGWRGWPPPWATVSMPWKPEASRTPPPSAARSPP